MLDKSGCQSLLCVSTGEFGPTCISIPLLDFIVIPEQLVQTASGQHCSLDLMGTRHSCLRTEQTITLQHQFVDSTLLVVYSTGGNGVPTFLLPVDDVEHLGISIPIFYVVVLVECSAVLLPKNMQQVGLQAPPDADDVPNLNHIFVGFEVVVGAVVDFGDGLGHDGHHGFDAFDVVEFLEL